VVISTQKNNLKIVSHLTKTEKSRVIWLNIVAVVARRVRLLHTCARTPTPLVSCIVNDGLVSAHTKHAENSASVHNTLDISSSAVAKRPRDASCLSVVSFNSTKRRVVSFIVSYYVGYRFITACS